MTGAIAALGLGAALVVSRRRSRRSVKPDSASSSDAHQHSATSTLVYNPLYVDATDVTKSDNNEGMVANLLYESTEQAGETEQRGAREDEVQYDAPLYADAADLKTGEYMDVDPEMINSGVHRNTNARARNGTVLVNEMYMSTDHLKASCSAKSKKQQRVTVDEYIDVELTASSSSSAMYLDTSLPSSPLYATATNTKSSGKNEQKRGQRASRADEYIDATICDPEHADQYMQAYATPQVRACSEYMTTQAAAEDEYVYAESLMDVTARAGDANGRVPGAHGGLVAESSFSPNADSSLQGDSLHDEDHSEDERASDGYLSISSESEEM